MSVFINQLTAYIVVIDCYQYNRPRSNVANFKLPFCSLLASTERNHKETKPLPRSIADQQLPVTSQHNRHDNCKEEYSYQLHKLVLWYTPVASNVLCKRLKSLETEQINTVLEYINISLRISWPGPRYINEQLTISVTEHVTFQASSSTVILIHYMNIKLSLSLK
jgi:hypothetical protein